MSSERYKIVRFFYRDSRKRVIDRGVNPGRGAGALQRP